MKRHKIAFGCCAAVLLALVGIIALYFCVIATSSVSLHKNAIIRYVSSHMSLLETGVADINRFAANLPEEERMEIGKMYRVVVSYTADETASQKRLVVDANYAYSSTIACQPFASDSLESMMREGVADSAALLADGVLKFSCRGKGFGPSTAYSGFYYSPAGEPLNLMEYEDKFEPLQSDGKGWSSAEKEGDNRFYTELITGNFYYYEEFF